MSEHTATPWEQGRTLRTHITAGWTAEQWTENERREERLICAHFSAVDEGRSREIVAEVRPGPDAGAYARLIAAAPDLMAALKARPGNRATWDKQWLEDEIIRGTPAVAEVARWELQARAAIEKGERT